MRGEGEKLTSAQLPRPNNSKILLIIPARKRKGIDNVITPKPNEINTQAVIMIIPDVKLVTPQTIFFDML